MTSAGRPAESRLRISASGPGAAWTQRPRRLTGTSTPSTRGSRASALSALRSCPSAVCRRAPSASASSRATTWPSGESSVKWWVPRMCCHSTRPLAACWPSLADRRPCSSKASVALRAAIVGGAV